MLTMRRPMMRCGADWMASQAHGLLSGRLTADPLADIIQDVLQITRATADGGSCNETTESAYTELIEYLRAAAQLTYEELAEFRQVGDAAEGCGALH